MSCYTLSILSDEKIHGDVHRLTYEKFYVDVYRSHFDATVGDSVNITCSPDTAHMNKHAYVAHGYIVKSDAVGTTISCGGLIMTLPLNIQGVNTESGVYVGITKKKGTKRLSQTPTMKLRKRNTGAEGRVL